MAAITKSALKAIKFYKHVVQSVEKFIQKVIVVFNANYNIVSYVTYWHKTVIEPVLLI